MASEIRVLEDQLYEADYQNRILREKLERSRQSEPQRSSDPKRSRRGAPEQIDSPSLAPSTDPRTDRPASRSDSTDRSDKPLDFYLDQELDESFIDPGVPMPMDQVGDPFLDDEKLEQPSGSPENLLPPIGLPEPPGKSDINGSTIEPGEILPPPDPDGKAAPKPPGQILLPDAVKALEPNLSIPDRLELHLGLSGGHSEDVKDDRREDKVDGMLLVVRAVDRRGTVIDLDSFDIDAEMTIVALDPAREGSQTKIGRWEFTPEQVKSLIQSRPISGFHVPVLWQGETPNGDEVIVHVRLRSEGDEMKCEGRVNVKVDAMVARWTPRADTARK